MSCSEILLPLKNSSCKGDFNGQIKRIEVHFIKKGRRPITLKGLNKWLREGKAIAKDDYGNELKNISLIENDIR